MVGFQVPMPLDDGSMVVHMSSNPLIFKHGKFGIKLGQKCDQTPLNDIQSPNLVKEFNAHDLLTFAISHVYKIFSGGRLKGSKHNLNFHGATWHHFKHLQSKFFSQCIIICKLNRNHCHVIATAVATT